MAARHLIRPPMARLRPRVPLHAPAILAPPPWRRSLRRRLPCRFSRSITRLCGCRTASYRAANDAPSHSRSGVASITAGCAATCFARLAARVRCWYARNRRTWRMSVRGCASRATRPISGPPCRAHHARHPHRCPRRRTSRPRPPGAALLYDPCCTRSLHRRPRRRRPHRCRPRLCSSHLPTHPSRASRTAGNGRSSASRARLTRPIHARVSRSKPRRPASPRWTSTSHRTAPCPPVLRCPRSLPMRPCPAGPPRERHCMPRRPCPGSSRSSLRSRRHHVPRHAYLALWPRRSLDVHAAW